MTMRLAYLTAAASFAIVAAMALTTRDRHTILIALAAGAVALGIYAAHRLRG